MRWIQSRQTQLNHTGVTGYQLYNVQNHFFPNQKKNLKRKKKEKKEPEKKSGLHCCLLELLTIHLNPNMHISKVSISRHRQ